MWQAVLPWTSRSIISKFFYRLKLFYHFVLLRPCKPILFYVDCASSYRVLHASPNKGVSVKNLFYLLLIHWSALTLINYRINNEYGIHISHFIIVLNMERFVAHNFCSEKAKYKCLWKYLFSGNKMWTVGGDRTVGFNQIPFV